MCRGCLTSIHCGGLRFAHFTCWRPFLRPSRSVGREWITAVTLDRFHRLPGVSQPTWIEYLYYERTLLAAVILVGLCLFATLSSPVSKRKDTGGILPNP